MKFTIQIPERLNDRLRAHRKKTGITTRHFATEAIEAALDKDGIPRVVKRSKPAQSA